MNPYKALINYTIEIEPGTTIIKEIEYITIGNTPEEALENMQNVITATDKVIKLEHGNALYPINFNLGVVSSVTPI